ncbi:MAG: hypothetical protein GF383_05035 [Candidatus Lokiarchaeota archaeon]|nr:hypothetical protein [Candidatus Lokiarchaeota archaeon]MBD3339242.1 hypothetical protein [Candidatus Lokiarchaeota archaeon]
MPKGGKKILRFYNNTGSLECVIQFLEQIQKKVNYIDLNATVDGKDIKITLYGSRDLQYLAIERIRDLADSLLG